MLGPEKEDHRRGRRRSSCAGPRHGGHRLSQRGTFGFRHLQSSPFDYLPQGADTCRRGEGGDGAHKDNAGQGQQRAALGCRRARSASSPSTGRRRTTPSPSRCTIVSARSAPSVPDRRHAARADRHRCGGARLRRRHRHLASSVTSIPPPTVRPMRIAWSGCSPSSSAVRCRRLRPSPAFAPEAPPSLPPPAIYALPRAA